MMNTVLQCLPSQVCNFIVLLYLFNGAKMTLFSVLSNRMLA